MNPGSPQTSTIHHRLLLVVSLGIIIAELGLLIYHHSAVVDWISHNLWIVLVPFAKVIFKKLALAKLLTILKSAVILGWHLSKLLVLKLFKTLFLRYGVYFSQHRWYWIRWTKVMFLRRGKQFFRSLRRFWSGYDRPRKWIIFVAFFPAVILLAFLGLSFNITRKTMVQRTQETALFKVATSAGRRSNNLNGWIARLDMMTLQKIRDLSLPRRPVGGNGRGEPGGGDAPDQRSS